MQFYRDMYVSPEIRHPGEIKRRLQRNAGGLSLYVITLCDDTQGQLQMFPAVCLRQPYLRKNCPMIMGVAQGRANAVKLIERMIRECYECTGNAELIPFLAKRDTRIKCSGTEADEGNCDGK